MIRERLLTEADREALAKAITEDDTHPNVVPEFYYAPEALSFVYENDRGTVMFVRYSSALRINLQFDSGATKLEIADALRSVFPSVAERAKRNRYCQVVFTSVSRRLTAFCRRYLKFQPSPDEHVLWL